MPIMKQPTLTNNPKLLELMRYEFHAPTTGLIDKSEPNNFLKRLTQEQIKLLNSSKADKERLTVFITFGDGFIDRPMGADFGEDYRVGTVSIRDIIRPNSSFAIFYKHTNGDLELAFYTRFFVINYVSSTNRNMPIGMKGARELCYELDQLGMSDPARPALRKKIFKAMSRRNQIKHGCQEATLMRKKMKIKPIRYGLFIGPVKHQTLGGEAIPWINIGESKKVGGKVRWKIARFMYGVSYSSTNRRNWSTIHGVHNTSGCWMLLRNYTWLWPNENDKLMDFPVYQDLVKCYHKYRRSDWTTGVKNCIKSINTALAKESEFLLLGYNDKNIMLSKNPYSRNYTYYKLLNLLAGLKYNLKKDHISIETKNCWDHVDNKPTVWANNVYGKQLTYNNDMKNHFWAYLYLFKRTKDFTPDPGDINKFD